MKKQIILTNLLLALVCSLLSTGVFAQVKTWGRNINGQLGDGTTADRPLPTILSSLTDVIDIDGGYIHSLTVRANGTVLAWGYNFDGELGNGTINNTGCACNPTPGAVSGLTNVTAASVGERHSLALKSDGTVWAWGQNLYGQLGDTTITQRTTPVRVGVGVGGFNNIIAIDAGSYHNLALKSDGSIWVWGDNRYGQLGDGTTANRYSPIQILSAPNANLAISAGVNNSMALTVAGRVLVWGTNDFGQIGNGTRSLGGISTPSLVSNLENVAQIRSGYSHSVALKTDGTVWAWGKNYNGEIGNGTLTTTGCYCIPTPTQSTITGVTAIRADTHTLARRITGFIRAWGYNQFGQIGNGTTNPAFPYGVSTPVQSSVGSGNVIFGTGYMHSLLSIPIVPTPPGTNVTVRLGDASVRFTSVIFNGVKTTIKAISPTSTGMTAPSGLIIAANNQAYDIATTFASGTNVTVCIKATNEYDQTEFNKLRLLHGIDGTLVDKTVSRDYQRREICASASYISSSISPFVLAKSLAPTAAQVSVSGRVLNQSGGGIAKAQVTVVSTDGVQRTVLTNSSGYYSVGEIGAGEFVTISISANGYLFESTQLAAQAMEDLTEINFSGTQFGLTKQNF